MRPYFAILHDAFREALASRVLWALLLITSFLLVALAGFTLDERAAATLGGGELRQPRELVRKLRQATPGTPGQRVWNLFSEDTRTKLDRQSADATEQDASNALVTALNRLLSERDLPGESAWPYERLDEEGRELRGETAARLSSTELARYNRLLLEAAFPDSIAPGRERELYVAFYGLEVPVGAMPPLRRDFMIRTAVGTISSFFLGYLGLFAGIIVTAGVIPHTFEPGAIDLLLSKPVSRTGVYLGKFVGGCMFVLLNTVFLLGGLWLLVGLRHGVWIGSLPLCIPVFLFWFMVFYSVSALVGLIWRNAIVAITITIALWGFCALLSFVKNQIVEALILDPERLTIIVPSEKGLFGAADTGQVYRWNEAAEHWDEILIPDDPRRWRSAGTGLPAGPLVDPTDGRVLTVQRTGRRFGGLFNSSSPLVYGGPTNGYRREESQIAPSGSTSLARDRAGRVVAVGATGIFALSGSLDGKTPIGPSLFGVELPLPGVGRERTEFVSISPAQRWLPPLAVDFDGQTDRIAVFQRGQSQIFRRTDGGEYEEVRKRAIPDHEHGVVAICGAAVILGYEDGVLEVFDLATLESRGATMPIPGVPPRFLEASPDGRRCAALFHDRTLRLWDAESNTWSDPPVDDQGDLSAIAWDARGMLWCVAGGREATAYDVEHDFLIEQTAREAPGWLTLTDGYLLKPLYAILPKTGETWNLVNYLLTDEKTILRGTYAGGLRSQRTPLDLRGPVISHAAFIVVMLAIGCWIIRRSDY